MYKIGFADLLHLRFSDPFWILGIISLILIPRRSSNCRCNEQQQSTGARTGSEKQIKFFVASQTSKTHNSKFKSNTVNKALSICKIQNWQSVLNYKVLVIVINNTLADRLQSTEKSKVNGMKKKQIHLSNNSFVKLV